jgi:hypothetical protein
MPAKLFRHKFQSAIADGADATLVRPQANWNGDDHDLRLGGRTVTAATDTIVTTDELSLIKYNRSSAIAVSIAAPDANNFQPGWLTFLRNIGVGLVTITPPGGTTINLGVGAKPSMSLRTAEDAVLISDGTNFDGLIRSGSLFSRPGQIPGTQLNDNAQLGNVGEFSSLTTGTIGLVTDQPTSTNFTNLGPGDWDLDGSITFSSSAASTTYINYLTGYFSINQYGPGVSAQFAVPMFGYRPFLYVGSITKALPTTRVLVPAGSSSAVFVAAQAGFAAGGLINFVGSVSARRVR